MGLKKPPEEHENHERWLVSYADFITLLFAFFVVLYASSQLDLDKLKKLSGSLKSSFAAPGGDPRPGGGAGPNAEAHADGGSMHPSPASSGPEEAGGAQRTGTPTLARVLDEARTFVSANALEDSVRLQIIDNQLMLAFRDTSLFRAGTSDLTANGKDLLARVGTLIANLTNPIQLRARATPSGVGAVRRSPFGLAGSRLESVSGYLSRQLNFTAYRFLLLAYGDHGGTDDHARGALPLPERGWFEVVVGPSRQDGEAVELPPVMPPR